MDNIGTLLSHNIWQSIIIFAVVFVVLRLIKTSSAEERSWSWSATLFILAFLPMAAFLPGEGLKIPSQTQKTDFTLLEKPVLVTTSPVTTLNEPIIQNRATSETMEPSTIIIPDRNQMLNWLLILWAIGTGFALLRLGIASYSATRLKQMAYPFEGVNDDAWPENIEIAVSDEITSPIVIGIIKPLILIPRTFAYGMDYNDLKPLLYHELAHIKRGDMAFLLVERIVLAIYWWNPIMHIIAKHIAEERELACDDRAAKHCGDQLVYASSLLKGARKLMGTKNTVLGLAVLRRESILSKRVKRMTVTGTLEGFNTRRLIKNMSILLVAVLALGIVTPRIAIGQTGDEFQQADQEIEIDRDIDIDIDHDVDIDRDIDIDREIEEGLEGFPSEEELERMREEIEREIENIPSVEELAQIHKEALESLPTMEEIEEMRREAIEEALSEEEIEEIRREAMESIPSIEELEEMMSAAVLSQEEMEEIRREALDSIPTVEEMQEMHRRAMESIPTQEEIEHMRKEVLESLLTKEDLEKMRQDMEEALDSLPSREELEKMKEDVGA